MLKDNEEKLELKEGAMWLNNTMKNVLQEVYDHYRSVVRTNDYLREENERLKCEAYKDEELAKMKEQYEKMKADYYRGFGISEAEDKKIKDWMEKLPSANTGAIGGRFTYQFICTSIGDIGTVKDSVTGEEFTFREL
jgi:hypothetical protein